ncbi:histidine-rich glycoprotein-like [Macrosteles quadrilineatus]|uniref:histidine-rich glycoprotein-like n=1 Tax=Macrosteles quadrilineatus TaxID=74068 RepID=UPI0023E0C596|nr:histidine-rich glycoprotein-like [Macrosteles quadrilineatus]
MDYQTFFLTVAAVLVQQAVCAPEFSLFHPLPLHHGSQPHHHAVPVVQHNGFLADTHEVAAAKSAHLAAVAAHGHHQYPTHHQEYSGHQEYPVHHQEYPVHHQEYPVHRQEYPVYHQEYLVHNQELPSHHQELPVHHFAEEHVQKYHGPTAIPIVLHNGHLADTPEVAVAKSHHLAAVAQAKADKYYSGHQEYGYGGSYGYSGSHHGYGIPVVLPNGHIADTKEVAAAKSAHLLAVANAKAEKYYAGHGDYGYGGAYGYSSSHHGYGIPVVLPNGHLADTHEVAAAKTAHMEAVAHAKSQSHHEHEHEPLRYYVPHHAAHPSYDHSYNYASFF